MNFGHLTRTQKNVSVSQTKHNTAHKQNMSTLASKSLAAGADVSRKAGAKALSLVVPLGLMVLSVVLYSAAMAYFRKKTSHPLFESIASTGLSAVLAASASTLLLDRLFDANHPSPAVRFMTRLASYWVVFTAVMLITTQVNGRLPEALAAGGRGAADTFVNYVRSQSVG